jgi:hypothetical protein
MWEMRNLEIDILQDTYSRIETAKALGVRLDEGGWGVGLSVVRVRGLKLCAQGFKFL